MRIRSLDLEKNSGAVSFLITMLVGQFYWTTMNSELQNETDALRVFEFC
jgi:hypothetical protein